MPIEFSCGCGRTLRVPDARAGRKARCPTCQAVVRVPPAPPPSPPVAPTAARPVPLPTPARVDRPAAPAPALDYELLPAPVRPTASAVVSGNRERDGPRPKRPRRAAAKKAAGRGAGRTKIAVLAAGLGVALLGGLACVGVGVYLLSSSDLGAGTTEDRLVGAWELDTDAMSRTGTGGKMGADLLAGSKLVFHPDHTFRQTVFGFDAAGRWQFVGGTRTTVTVTLTYETMMGLAPPGKGGPGAAGVECKIRFTDADHIEIDQTEPAQGQAPPTKMLYRRAGR